MNAGERISKGLELETECAPFTQEDFNALLDTDSAEFTPRELRLMSTLLVLVAQSSEMRSEYQEQIKGHLMLNGVLKAKEIRKDHYIERMLPLLKLNMSEEAKALMQDMQNEYGERVPQKDL